MGIDKLSFGRDYAAEFTDRTQLQSDELRRKMESLKVTTVPMVDRKKDDVKDDNMGLEVEQTSDKNAPAQDAEVAEKTDDKAVKENEKQDVSEEKAEDKPEQKADEKPADRTLNTKEGRKILKEETSKAYQEHGTVTDDTKIDKKQADKMADEYVKNKERIEKSDHTVSFIDDEACKKAKKEQKQKEKDLEKYYQTEEGGGLSKREAKAKVKAQHIEYRHIGNKDAQKFIKDHPELFCDKNGNYSADIARETVRTWANLHTKEGEAENGYLSLQERREIAEKYGVKDDVIADIAKNTGHGFEKDNTEGRRVAYVAGTTAVGAGIGAGIGALTRAKATATAESAAVAKDAAGNVLATGSNVATATASATGLVPGIIGGAVTGLGFGLATMHKIKDNGSPELRAYEPGKEQEIRHIVKIDSVKPKIDVKLPNKPDLEIIDVPTPQPCIVVVQNGESLSRLAKKYGVSVDQIINMNRDKLKYFHNSKDCADNKKYAGFLVGEEIVIPNGCDKADGNKDSEGAIKDYENAIRKKADTLCGDRKNEWSSEQFRKQNKIGEFEE